MFRKNRQKTARGKHAGIVKLIIGALLIIAVAVIFFLRSGSWDGKSKLSVVINNRDKVVIATFDPVNDQIANITIPAETQVVVSRQMGTWKLGSIWQLGDNEDLGGQLLAETVTNYFTMPVYSWADAPALGFTGNSFSENLKALITPYKSNLGLSDRVRLALFAASVKNPDIETIDLSETSALSRSQLKEGSVGYIFSGNLPSKLLLVFSDHELASENLRVSIVDETGGSSAAQNAGEVVQVLGAKVTAIDYKDEAELDCVIRGKKSLSLIKISKIFGCSADSNLPEGNFDLQLILGKAFADRF